MYCYVLLKKSCFFNQKFWLCTLNWLQAFSMFSMFSILFFHFSVAAFANATALKPYAMSRLASVAIKCFLNHCFSQWFNCLSQANLMLFCSLQFLYFHLLLYFYFFKKTKQTNKLIKTIYCETKDALSDLRQFLAAESPLKMKEINFHFNLKALFVLKIFTLLSWFVGQVENSLIRKKVNLTIYDVKPWLINKYNTNIAQNLKK